MEEADKLKKKSESALAKVRLGRILDIEKSLAESGYFAVNRMDDEGLKKAYQRIFEALNDAICMEARILSEL